MEGESSKRAQFEELKNSVHDSDLKKSHIDDVFAYGAILNTQGGRESISQVLTTCQGQDTTVPIQPFDGEPILTNDLTGIPLSRSLFPFTFSCPSSMEEDTDPEADLDVSSSESESDDDEEEVDPKGIIMLARRRTPILDKFPTGLGQNPYLISVETAKKCLSEDRHNLLTGMKPERVFLSDSLEFRRLYVVLETGKLPKESLLSHPIGQKFLRAAGKIRNQRRHLLCWEYAVGDLISSTRVLEGLDKKFEPMAPMYLSQLADPRMFEKQPRVEKGELHLCFEHDEKDACRLAKLHGVVKVEKGDPKKVVCTQRTDFSDRKKYLIKDFHTYNKLEDACTRLKTTPILAGLTCFTGWEDKAIYRGPLKENSEYEGEHLVIIFNITEIDGESVAICKSSNGKNVGYFQDGFIVVSLEVMIMLAGKSRKKDDRNRLCYYRPQHLLYDFLSIELEKEPEDKEEKSKILKKKNKKKGRQERETDP